MERFRIEGFNDSAVRGFGFGVWGLGLREFGLCVGLLIMIDSDVTKRKWLYWVHAIYMFILRIRISFITDNGI